MGSDELIHSWTQLLTLGKPSGNVDYPHTPVCQWLSPRTIFKCQIGREGSAPLGTKEERDTALCDPECGKLSGIPRNKGCGFSDTCSTAGHQWEVQLGPQDSSRPTLARGNCCGSPRPFHFHWGPASSQHTCLLLPSTLQLRPVGGNPQAYTGYLANPLWGLNEPGEEGIDAVCSPGDSFPYC